MRFSLAVAVSIVLASTVRGETLTVWVQESVVVEIAGATAAYTTNPEIADVSLAAGGRLSVTGQRVGTTQLVIITASGTHSFLIRVAAATSPSAIPPKAGAPLVRYEGRYSSYAGRVQSSLDVVTNASASRSEFHILHLHHFRAGADPSADAIGSVFFRRATPGREWTLLDETVDASPLTVSNTQVRGLHLRQGPLELHGGYASATMYDGFFLSSERRWVAGVGYGFDFRSTRWTPSVYGFFSAPEGTGARRGVVGTLEAEHRRGESLLLRGEIGVSRSLAMAGELRHVSARGQLHGAFSFKPDDFPTLGLADVRGVHAELDWSRRSTGRLSITSRGAYDRFTLAAFPQAIGSAGFGVGYALSPRSMLHAGADISEVRTRGAIRTIGLPLGVTYEAPSFGMAASYRLLDHSAASRRGDSLRLSSHAGRGRWSTSIWGERQRQAPTLDLIFSSTPGLELALLRLGISARSPEDVARALRDNAALIDLGFITGVNVDLTPKRVQAGLNLGWRGSDSRNSHLRFLAVYGRDEGVRATRDSSIASLTYSRRVLTATDLYGSYSWWRTGIREQQESGTSTEIGLRQQFSLLPRFLRRSGTIDGFVFLDPRMQGTRGEGTSPLTGIVVTLDGDAVVQRTDSRGAFAFHDVPSGSHRIEAQLPLSPRAFFTTPSHIETQVSAHVDFGVVWAAARIDGQMLSDAGLGIAGVVLTAAAEGGIPIAVTSGEEGRFVFIVPAGTFRVAVSPDSLPPGYSIARKEQSVIVEPDRPHPVSFAVQVLRSVAGRAKAGSEVRIESLGRAVPADEQGNFLFRSMPSGTFTISAHGGGPVVSASVTLPAEPVMIRDVVLLAAASIVANAAPPFSPAVGRKAVPETPLAVVDQGVFRVQAGAFRSSANAAVARKRIERLGMHAAVTRSGSLELLMLGPFGTRDAAKAAATRLREGGVDAVLVAGRGSSRPPSPSPVAGSHVVQAGAFREERNTRELLGRLQRSGEHAFTVTSASLTLVYVGPFASRRDALEVSARLHRAGFEGFVTRLRP